uniref:dCTP pyrophosphatase 1-like n=1 Tax=Erigeron canadensis TaxID=72917 RepID=UPI001CB8F9D0|nr:dCTP pyrophosphatase 1-like [Erigeron canadensis]
MHEHSLVERHKQRGMDAFRKVEEDDDRDISLKDLSKKLQDFAKARDWEKYHTPRNLLLAMIGEVGELSEIFQWKGEVEKGLENWEESEKEHLGEELSDVLLYLIRLADICGIDLTNAALNKILKNSIKYPPPDPLFITKGEQSSNS